MYKDPEKQKEYRRKYYQEHKEQAKAKQRKYSKEYYNENKEEILSKQKEYYYRTHDKQKEYRRNNYQKYKKSRLQYCKEYNKKHPELMNEITTKYHRRVNSASRLTAHNHRELWTPGDIEILEHMVKQGCTYKEIAIRLGRTISSISTKLNRMRKNGDPFNGNPVDI